jgi:hypothetical protein
MSAQNVPTPRLQVDGRWLRDQNGNTVSLRGLNTVDPWWGTNYQQMGDADYYETLERLTNMKRDWYPRVFRVPFQHSLDEVGIETTIEEYMRPIVDFLGDRNCYVILDYHRIERWDTDDIDQRLRDFWNAVAPLFADDPHVLFELFNEPTEPYGDGVDDWTAWRKTAQPWVDLVRSHAPDTPLIVGSPRWSSYTRYARDDPFEGDNLLYAAHVYPSHRLDYDMDALAAVADDFPLFMSEWGYVNEKNKDDHMVGTTSGYGESIRDYLESIPNMSWTAWCADSQWSPAMFDTDGTLRTGEDYMGGFTKQYLTDVRDLRLPTTRLIDTFDSWDTVDRRSTPENWTLDSSNPERFDGNTSRLTRQNATTTEFIEYDRNRIRNVSAKLYYWESATPDEVSLYASSDGDRYTELATTTTEPVDTGGNWRTVDLRTSERLPTATRTLRVQVGGGGRSWDKQLSSIRIDHSAV